MKATTKKEKVMLVTKFILAKPFKYFDGCNETTYKKGRVLEIIRHRYNYYYPTNYVIVLGYGWTETIPADHIKAKWYKETTKTVIKTKEVPVK